MLGETRRPRASLSGYRCVAIQLYSKRKKITKSRRFTLSRLVGFLFLRKRRRYETQIDHKNRDRGDDRVQNLRWVSPAMIRANRGARRR